MNFRILVLTGLTLLVCKTASAQDVEFGVKAGANMSTLKTDLDGEKYLLGYHFGGLADIKFNEKFSIQPELLYSLEGAKLMGLLVLKTKVQLSVLTIKKISNWLTSNFQ